MRKAFVFHVAKPGLIPVITYGLLSPPDLFLSKELDVIYDHYWVWPKNITNRRNKNDVIF